MLAHMWAERGGVYGCERMRLRTVPLSPHRIYRTSSNRPSRCSGLHMVVSHNALISSAPVVSFLLLMISTVCRNSITCAWVPFPANLGLVAASWTMVTK